MRCSTSYASGSFDIARTLSKHYTVPRPSFRKAHQADIPWYSLQEQIICRSCIETRAELLHVPHWNLSLGYRGPLIVTIHDLLLRHQTTSSKAQPVTRWLPTKQLGYRFLLRQVVRRASLLLVPTQFVAQDVHTLYPSSKGKTIVTGEGITTFLHQDTRFVPAEPYLLYVGSAYPHKRLDLLFSAWQKMAPRYPRHQLIVAGEEDVFMARHVAWVKHHQIPRVHFLGRVRDSELAALYVHASGFVFPSSYEGMGLPPLEALAFGTPVIASDAAALPEVLPHEGVFFFRNGDADGIIRAIDAVLSDEAAARTGAVQGSLLVRQRFTWKQVAQCTLEAYERIVHH